MYLYLMYLYLVGTLMCSLLNSASAESCSFPASWRNKWLINGFGKIVEHEITRNSFISKGQCVNSRGTNSTRKTFLLRKTAPNREDPTCYTCMIFTERHVNVIQFKEVIECNPDNTDSSLMDRLCNKIYSVPTLHTLVRKNAVPIKCPTALHQSSSFVYDKGDGVCTSDDSAIGPCASNQRFHATFGQCPSIDQYDKEEVELQCLADWTDGGHAEGWLYVKYGADNYRCMFYNSMDKTLGMSSDASCTGISVIFSAPVYINWSDSPDALAVGTDRCSFPSWFNGEEWVNLENSVVYRYDKTTNELVVDEQRRFIHENIKYTETTQRMTCHRKASSTSYGQRFVTRVLNGCKYGYQCLIFQRKSDTVVELVAGALSSHPGRACSSNNLNSPSAQRRVLVDISAISAPCPELGSFSLQHPVQSQRCSTTLEMGCSGTSDVTLKECGVIKSTLKCLASWTEGRTSHLIISQKTEPHIANCYTYKMENSEVEIELDEECNGGAPRILNITGYSAPFRLRHTPNQCRGEQVSDSGKNYQTQDKSHRNIGHTLLVNICILCMSVCSVVLNTAIRL